MSVPHNRSMVYQFGPLKIWILRKEYEWLLAWNRDVGDEYSLVLGCEEEKPDHLEWNQWITFQEDELVNFLPTMPDRALIVRPQYSSYLTVGSDCIFYCLIPISVAVFVGSNLALRLVEIPTMELSNSWHGDTMTGELGYAMRFPVQFSIADPAVGPHRVVCPIHIKNKSNSELEIQRIYLQVKHLNIYQGEANNRTDQVLVIYEGKDQDNKIHYENPITANGKASTVISPCREPVSGGILKRGFDNLMSISF